ncbi:putative legume lectin, alpha chain, concanavalin A-like lectin/glucanase domain superfamily [Helianthus anomalus]
MGILAFFLFILITYAASISFNLENISPNDKDMFILDGGANISEDAIQVTPKNHSGMVIGRVTYTERLHLWDKRSGELASFSTSFSFVKLSDLERRHRQDDGFIFFLAQNSSLIHGAMDPKSDTRVNDSEDRYVWVEFDPYCNTWENSSQCDHVGINVNSDSSINQTKWLNTGRECQVLIKYKNLSVSFTSFRKNNFERDGVAHIVDLQNELPEWVAFGFSAASFELSDKNTVESWMFNSSNLQLDENTGLPPNKLGLVVGLVVGKSVLVTLLVILAYLLWNKKKNNGGEEV